MLYEIRVRLSPSAVLTSCNFMLLPILSALLRPADCNARLQLAFIRQLLPLWQTEVQQKNKCKKKNAEKKARKWMSFIHSQASPCPVRMQLSPGLSDALAGHSMGLTVHLRVTPVQLITIYIVYRWGLPNEFPPARSKVFLNILYAHPMPFSSSKTLFAITYIYFLIFIIIFFFAAKTFHS